MKISGILLHLLENNGKSVGGAKKERHTNRWKQYIVSEWNWIMKVMRHDDVR